MRFFNSTLISTLTSYLISYLNSVLTQALSNQPTSQRRQFFNGFFLLFLQTIVIVIFWALLGWESGAFLGTNDVTAYALIYQNLLQSGGAWWNSLYTPMILGGAHVHATYGSSLLYVLWAVLDFSFVNAINLTTICLQVLLSYLSYRCIRHHNISLLPDNYRPTTNTGSYYTPLSHLGLAVFTALFIGFSPLLIWRLAYGHQSFIFGLLFFAAVLTLYLETTSRKKSLFAATITVFSLILSLSAFAPQLTLYSCLFLPPFICAISPAVSKKKWRRNWLKLSVLSLLAIFISLPLIWAPAWYGASQSTSRSLTDLTALYSYALPTISDILSGWTWFFTSFEARPQFYLHEINYPIGAIFLGFVFWALNKKNYKILLIYLTIVIIFSLICLNQQPIASYFTKILAYIVPPIRAFRVPMRFFIIVNFFASLLAFSWIFASTHFLFPPSSQLNRFFSLKRGGFVIIIALLLGFISFNSSPLINEIFVYLWIVSLFVLTNFKKTLAPIINHHEIILIFLLHLFILNFLAVKIRIPEFMKNSQKVLIRQEQKPLSLLDRTQLLKLDTQWGFHSGFFNDLPSLTGYLLPDGHFLQLTAALNNQDYSRYTHFYSPKINDPGFDILNKLYNVRRNFHPLTGFTPENSESQPYWTNQYIEEVPSLMVLVQKMKTPDWSPSEKILLIKSTSKTILPVASQPIETCQKMNSFKTLNHPFRLQLAVTTKTGCYVTFATNFSPFFEANLMTSTGKRIQQKIFRSYGALTSAHITESGILTIKTVSQTPWFIYVLGAFSLIILFMFLPKWFRIVVNGE